MRLESLKKSQAYDEKFVVASVQNFFNACNYIRKLGKSNSGANNQSANLNEAKASKPPASFMSPKLGKVQSITCESTQASCHGATINPTISAVSLDNFPNLIANTVGVPNKQEGINYA